MFNFIVIDPRNPVVPPNTLGVEVTIPEIAARCDLGNIDPQHGCGRVSYNGEEIAEMLGAMAVLALRAGGVSLTSEALARIASVAAADGNTRTTWAPRVLPSRENPWPAGGELTAQRQLAAIAHVCGLHTCTVAWRVAIVAAWLLGGDEPTPEQVHTAAMAVLPSLSVAPFNVIDTLRECREHVESERADMIAALGDGRIKIDVRLKEGGWGATVDGTYSPIHSDQSAEREFAIVRSAHRAATMLGQCVAPLAICFHPAFRWPSGATTPKATIAWAVPPGAEVVQRVANALNAAEREKIATQIDRVDLGVTYEGGWPGVFYDARPGRCPVGAASLLRGGHVAEALGVIANIAPADAERHAKDIAEIKAAIQGAWGGNLASGILGSPQGRASLLTEDEIVAIVRGAL